MRTKIYLAKSNRANPDDVSKVRSLLSKYKNDIELVEFQGGSYSHKDLKACDVLIVVPDLTNVDADDKNYIDIGKGLHEQIMCFKNQAQNDCDTLVVFEVDDDFISVTQVEDIDVADPDDYVNYSWIILDQDSGCELDSLILNRFVGGEYDTSQSTDKNYYYLLIGNK